MLDSDAEAAQYIDTWIASQFADVALCSEVLNSINSLAPWFDEQMAEKLLLRHPNKKALTKTKNLVDKIEKGMQEAAKSDKLAWDPETKNYFDYPIDKRRTQATTIQMRLSEVRLDRFWASVEAEVKKAVGISLAKVCLAAVLVSVRDFILTVLGLCPSGH